MSKLKTNLRVSIRDKVIKPDIVIYPKEREIIFNYSTDQIFGFLTR